MSKEVKTHIATTRKELITDPTLIWGLDQLLPIVKQDLQLNEITAFSELVDEKIALEQANKFLRDVFLGLLQLGLGIMALTPAAPGALALLCGISIAGISALMYDIHSEEYEFEHAAHNAAISPETALLSEEPEMLWLYLDLVFFGIDAVIALKMATALGKPFLNSVKTFGKTQSNKIVEHYKKVINESFASAEEKAKLFKYIEQNADNPEFYLKAESRQAKTIKNSDEVLENSGKERLSSEVGLKNKSNLIYQKNVILEPEITSMLETIAKKSGGKLEGLEFRLKTKESIKRKIKHRRIGYRNK